MGIIDNIKKSMSDVQPTKRVTTRDGKELDLITGKPTSDFWAIYRSNKTGLKQAGVSVGKNQMDEWEVKIWQEPPAHEIAEKHARIEQSRALDADIEVPANNGTKYRDFQLAGIRFLANLYNAGYRGGLLADDMGVGKTIQIIGLSNFLGIKKRNLIIVPNSVKKNWVKEIYKWSTSGSVDIAKSKQVSYKCEETGKRKTRTELVMPDSDWVVINYEMCDKFRPYLEQVEWGIIACDEAHRIKNEKAQATVAIIGRRHMRAKGNTPSQPKIEPLNGEFWVFATGTPVLNRPKELWVILHFIDPQGLGNNFMKFHLRYCDGKKNGFGWDFSGKSNELELQQKLRSSVMIRRLKVDVLKELPGKTRQMHELVLTSDMKASLAEMESAWEARVGDKLTGDEKDYEAWGKIVEDLGSSGTMGIAEMAEAREKLGVSKVPQSVAYIEEMLESVDKLVVFAHHKKVIDELCDKLAAYNPVRITGSDSIEARAKAEKDFNERKSCRVIVVSIKAGGVGLNLQAASTIVFVEYDWTWALLDQAEDRCNRMGQQNAVSIYYLVVADSIDTYILSIIISKWGTSEKILNESIELPAAPEEKKEAQEDAKWLEFMAVLEGAKRKYERERKKQNVARLISNRKAIELDLEKLGEKLSDTRKEWIIKNVRLLASADEDRASEENGVGFSKADVSLGHRLSELADSEWESVHYGVACDMLLKYHKQIGRIQDVH